MNVNNDEGFETFEPTATVPREGFDTRIKLDQFAMDVMVEALDADDNVLGQSDVVTTMFPRKTQHEQELDHPQHGDDKSDSADLKQELDIPQAGDGGSDSAQDEENHVEHESEDSSLKADHDLSRLGEGHSHLINAIFWVPMGCICVVLWLWICRRFKWTPGQLHHLSRTRYERLKQYEGEDE